MSNLLQIGNSYEIQTSSFYTNHFILNVSSNDWPLKELSFKSGTIKLPSVCDLLAESNYNCSNKNVLVLKVTLINDFRIIKKNLKNSISLLYSSLHYQWP